MMPRLVRSLALTVPMGLLVTNRRGSRAETSSNAVEPTGSRSALPTDSAEVPMLGREATRTNNFDAFRLILSLVVVFAHSFCLADGNPLREPGYRLMRGQFYTGDLAVCCFFMLSGYLITQSWERSRSAGSFARKRLLRIAPGYSAAFLFSLFVMVPLDGVPARQVWNVPTLMTNVWHLLWFEQPAPPPVFKANPLPLVVNGSLWTIPYEVRCYLGVAVLGTVGLLRRRWLLLGMTLGLVGFWFASAIYPLLHSVSPTVLWVFGLPHAWVRLASCFLGGMLVYRFRDAITWHWLGALGSVVTLLVACRMPPGLCLAIPTAGLYLFFYVAFHPGWSWPLASRHGDFSYGIYLFSSPIQQLIVAKFGAIAPMSLLAWSLLPSIVAGMLSWYLVERWFLGHRIPHRSGAAVAVAA